jgi:hypothetical protein
MERRSTGGPPGEAKDRRNRGFPRFIGSGSEPEDSATPQDSRREANAKPGDSAESPPIID